MYTDRLNSAWRHRREDHRCEEISSCPYRSEILLERRRFSNVNQIDEEFDPERPRPYREGVGASEDGELRLEDNQLKEWRATAGTEHSVRHLTAAASSVKLTLSIYFS